MPQPGTDRTSPLDGTIEAERALEDHPERGRHRHGDQRARRAEQAAPGEDPEQDGRRTDAHCRAGQPRHEHGALTAEELAGATAELRLAVPSKAQLTARARLSSTSGSGDQRLARAS